MKVAVIKVVVVILTTAAAIVSMPRTGLNLNRQAIQLAQNGDLQGALQKFHLALEDNPQNQELLNNLGVTLMRLGKFDPALDAFNRVLQIDPNHRDALDNRQELLQFMDSGNPVFQPSASTLTPRSKLPRISIDQLDSKSYEDYKEGRKPFILTGATKNWPLFQEGPNWIMEHMKAEFANSTADFYPHNMGRSTIRPYLVPLWKALDEFSHPSGDFPTDPAYPGTYIQWNVPLKEWGLLRQIMHPMPKFARLDEQWLRQCLTASELINEYSLRLHWRMVLIGTKNAGMFFHKDVLRGSSWQVQVAGAKRWTLCDPFLNSGKLYVPGEVDTFAPDLTKYPKFASTICYEDVVERGEMVFYPREFWHQTLNLETPAISITGTIVDENNHEGVEEELRGECSSGKWNWRLSSDLCDALEDCFDLWEEGVQRFHHPKASKPNRESDGFRTEL